ncbi:peptidoglycan binding protein CsiV [Ferrimonas sp. SCSIO 43195]|uniref:peptidoglycan binding protein CsiV n=1 Tax=Ferrimonas sp. SCSIO 43195 TaxID=2822844 RepID=UPI002075E75B|nr:peptidoglycan binding protein CsiV [Ferrimonas sp. SCSIO 43195]USD38764.1 peptidoglycan binding protein CsiV [Ferrimonas sp. SCSIO 43195]
MINLKALTAGLMLTLACSAPQAEEATWFEVEIAVFQRPQTTTETWSQETTPVKTADTLDLLGPAMMPDLSALEEALNPCDSSDWLSQPENCQPQPTEPATIPSQLPATVTALETGSPLSGAPFLLPAESLQFNDALAKLRHKGARVLLHSAWRQPVFSRGNSQAYRLYNGRNFSDRFYADGRLRPLTPPLGSVFDFNFSMTPPTAQAEPVWELDGWLRIYLNHFLFIDTSLQLREEGERPVPGLESMTVATPEADQSTLVAAEDGATSAATEPFLNTIELRQTRRVRSREIHYFDHPKMGVVIQIRRMTQPSEMEPATAATPLVTR